MKHTIETMRATQERKQAKKEGIREANKEARERARAQREQKEPMASIEAINQALEAKGTTSKEGNKGTWYEEAIRERREEKSPENVRNQWQAYPLKMLAKISRQEAKKQEAMQKEKEVQREETIEKALTGIQSEFEHIGKILERLSRQLSEKRTDKKSKDEWIQDLESLQEK